MENKKRKAQDDSEDNRTNPSMLTAPSQESTIPVRKSQKFMDISAERRKRADGKKVKIATEALNPDKNPKRRNDLEDLLNTVDINDLIFIFRTHYSYTDWFANADESGQSCSQSCGQNGGHSCSTTRTLITTSTNGA